MNDILTKALLIAIIVVIVLLAFYGIPILKTLHSRIKNKELKDFIEDCVRWAKQTFLDNETKKREVMDKVVAYVLSKGLDIPYEILDLFVEAIYEMVKKEKKED